MTKRPEPLAARLVADLRPVFEGWPDPIIAGTGFDGAIYAAARRSVEKPTVERALAVFPKSRFDQATDYLIVRWQDGRARTLVIPEERIVASYVQPLEDGILLVGVTHVFGTSDARASDTGRNHDKRSP